MDALESAPWWPELLAIRDDHSVIELARRFATTPVAIAVTFKRLGIAKVPRPQRDEIAVARAWEVRFRGRERPAVLVAGTFDQALGNAMRRGDVASVRLLGPTL